MRAVARRCVPWAGCTGQRKGPGPRRPGPFLVAPEVRMSCRRADRAEDLPYGRLGHLVVDAADSDERPGEGLPRRVLDGEGGRLAVVGAAARPVGTGRGGRRHAPGEAGLRGERLRGPGGDLFLRRLGVAAVDPQAGVLPGRLGGVAGVGLGPGANGGQRGVLLGAVAVVVGPAPVLLEDRRGGESDERGLLGVAVLRDVRHPSGRLDRPVHRYVEGDAALGVDHRLPAGHEGRGAVPGSAPGLTELRRPP